VAPVSSRWIFFLAAGIAALLAMAFAWPLVAGRPFADGSWHCSQVNLHVGSNTGASPRAALDRYLRAAGEPTDGWNLGEPNRFSRSTPDTQRVVSVNQTAPDNWEVVRSDVCRH